MPPDQHHREEDPEPRREGAREDPEVATTTHLADTAFRAMVEASSDLTAVIAPDGRIIHLSSAAVRTWGYEPSTLVGHDFMDFVHPDDRRLVADRFAMAMDMPGVTVGIELRIHRADGAWRYVETRTTNLIDNDLVHAVAVNLRDVHDRIEMARELKWRAHHDSLTGLLNRAAVMDRLDRRLEASGTNTLPAVLYVDLDGFKAVNDSFGHETGDRLLSVIGERLRATVRVEDVAARIGGDEFVILVETEATRAAVLGLAERIIEAIDRPIDIALPGEVPVVSASIGIAFAEPTTDRDQPDRASALLANADRALYQAKHRGRGQVEIFEREI